MNNFIVFKTYDNKVFVRGNITFTDNHNGITATKKWESDNLRDIIREMGAFTETL